MNKSAVRWPAIAAYALVWVVVLIAVFIKASSVEKSKLDQIEANTPGVVELVSLCTNQSITTRDMFDVALAQCVSRTYGYVQGHLVTVGIDNVRRGRRGEQKAPTSWCVPIGTSDVQLFNSMYSWTQTNPNEYKSIVDKMNDAGDTAIITVMYSAMVAYYPCS